MPQVNDGEGVQSEGVPSSAREFLARVTRSGRGLVDNSLITAGFAAALGCVHRSPAAFPGMPPAGEYPDTSCAISGGNDVCAPIRCPLAKTAVAALLSGIASKIGGARDREARPDGPPG